MSCVNNITNGAPLFLFRGVDDQSDQPVSIDAIPRPQHMPIFFIQAERGKLGPQIVSGAQRNLMYGANSFAENGLFTNHQTTGSNICQAAANAHILWRISNASYCTLRLTLS